MIDDEDLPASHTHVDVRAASEESGPFERANCEVMLNRLGLRGIEPLCARFTNPSPMIFARLRPESGQGQWQDNPALG